jgi:hypothetical protein
LAHDAYNKSAAVVDLVTDGDLQNQHVDEDVDIGDS